MDLNKELKIAKQELANYDLKHNMLAIAQKEEQYESYTKRRTILLKNNFLY